MLGVERGIVEVVFAQGFWLYNGTGGARPGAAMRDHGAGWFTSHEKVHTITNIKE